MAFKMNKKNVNFGEGTGSSPNKFSFFSGDNVANPNDGSSMGNMVGNLFTQENLDAVQSARNKLKGQGQRIDIPVDGGSDTVEGGNKQYASGFGPQGTTPGGIAGILEGIQNLLNQAGNN